MVHSNDIGRIRFYNVEVFNYADITFGKDATTRCDLLKIVPLFKVGTEQGEQAGTPPNKQPIDSRIRYENNGYTVIETLIADLNPHGYGKLILKENGDICIQQGEELVPQEHLPNPPAKAYWPRLAEVFKSNSLTVETTAQSTQVS